MKDWDGKAEPFQIHEEGWAAITAAVLLVGAFVLIGCNREDNDGSAYAKISHDQFDSCRVFVADMGRASPPVKPFIARIEGCKPDQVAPAQMLKSAE